MNRTSSIGLACGLLLALGACDRTGPSFGETRVLPSGATTGVKLPQSSFVVGENGAEIELVFDPERSAAHIVPTGSGRVLMTPVIGLRR